ncbi:hypothetical protein EG68_05286 [Paragonimus skrjabini miyazakii]|uniref:Uncharacterized protein n=1 Tax=Paragonimus skrjabini miyazakii TaxID=59628 RepID=A0A8S9Z0P3_9TREM|nr:hypothetical protein EG68_05286 [Paragonimus skrjabini miyazakii]
MFFVCFILLLFFSPGLKWGIAVGVVVTLIVFLTVSYTIQVFRTCDRCYHECPIFRFSSKISEFQWDTRWYTVSHEGNRYGVTFHSRLFANEFMKCLEAAYGRWNTANMLKIQRDGQDFVILNIFFHDLFTPWFYTQGPIKNDEEWIRSDFKSICLTVQAHLQVTPWNQLRQVFSCFKKPPNSNDGHNSSGTRETVESICLEQLNQCKPTASVESPDNRGYRKWVPWTKATIGMPVATNLAGQKLLSRTSTKRKYGRKSDKSETTQFVKLLIFEDIIECNGLDKGIQTGQKEVWTRRIDNTTSINISNVNV